MWLMEKYKAIAYLALLAVPSMLYAQANDVGGLLQVGGSILNSFVTVLIGVALVGLLFGIIKYVQAGDQEKNREEGRPYMLYGIIALFVMVSFWGLVQVLITSVNLNNSTLPIPQF